MRLRYCLPILLLFNCFNTPDPPNQPVPSSQQPRTSKSDPEAAAPRSRPPNPAPETINQHQLSLPFTYVQTGNKKFPCFYMGEFLDESVFVTSFQETHSPGGIPKSGLTLQGPIPNLPVTFLAGDRELGIAICSTGRGRLVGSGHELTPADLTALKETQRILVFITKMHDWHDLHSRSRARISALTTKDDRLTRIQVDGLGNTSTPLMVFTEMGHFIGLTYRDKETRINFAVPHTVIEGAIHDLFVRRNHAPDPPAPEREHTQTIELFDPKAVRNPIELPFIAQDWFLIDANRSLVIHHPEQRSIHAIELSRGVCRHVLDLAEGHSRACGGGNRIAVFYEDLSMFEVFDAGGTLIDVFESPVPSIQHIGMGRNNDTHMIVVSGETRWNRIVSIIELSSFEVISSIEEEDALKRLSDFEPQPIVPSPNMRYCAFNTTYGDLLMRWDGNTYDIDVLMHGDPGYAWDFNQSLVSSSGHIYSLSAKLIKDFGKRATVIPSIDSPHLLVQTEDRRSRQTVLVWVDCFAEVKWDGQRRSSLLPLEGQRSLFFGNSGMVLMFSTKEPKLTYWQIPSYKSQTPYVMVRSTPPITYEPGTRFEYQMEIHTQYGPLSCELIDAPSGMSVNDRGRIEWSVPRSQNLPADVMVMVTNARNIHCFHGFELIAGSP